jgi:hypothetical protein
VEYIWLFLSIAVCAGLAWVALKIEPHWVSKDGRRMLCMGQHLDVNGTPQGRWRETRVIIPESGQLQVDQKRFMRRSTSFWNLEQQAPAPSKRSRKAVFLLRGHDANGSAALLTLKLPANSRAVAVLEERLANR